MALDGIAILLEPFKKLTVCEVRLTLELLLTETLLAYTLYNPPLVEIINVIVNDLFGLVLDRFITLHFKFVVEFGVK